MSKVLAHAESERVSEARFILDQLAGLAGIIDQMREERHRDPEHRAALREMEQSFELLLARLRRVER